MIKTISTSGGGIRKQHKKLFLKENNFVDRFEKKGQNQEKKKKSSMIYKTKIVILGGDTSQQKVPRKVPSFLGFEVLCTGWWCPVWQTGRNE